MYKKTEQILNRSQRREAAQNMKFLINIDCLGTCRYCRINEKILKFKCFESRGVRIFEQISNGSRTKYGCLKAILSWSLETLYGVLLLCKFQEKFKPFKTSCEFIFF